jgi:phenylalanyl-tRNA synthetase beta chain
MLVIADPRGPVALAGIMGGRASEITTATRDVLLESAWFDPVTVRRAARALGMRTDASHRFERGADPQATLAALNRASALVAEVAGGTVTDPAIDAGPGPGPGRVITFRPGRVAALLGYDPGAGTGRRILESLGFAVEETRDGSWRVSVPSFRRDVEREVDLVEEIARHAGYDAIPAALPLLDTGRTGRARSDMVVRDGRRALVQGGLHEAVNFAMADAAECLRFRPGSVPVGLENPLQSGAAALRTTLLPHLVRNVSHNLNRGAAGCHLFEIGHAFLPGTERPAEIVRAAGVLAGRAPSDHWSSGPREVDIFDAKGMVELLARMTGDLTPRFSSARIAADGVVRGLEIEAGGKTVGVVGEIAPDVLREFGVDRRVFAFEVDLEALAGPAAGPTEYRSLPRHPAVRRDLALIAPERCTVDEIEALIRASSPLPIAEIEVFDRFRGAGLAKGTCSIALQLVFQHPERTLAAEEVQAAQDAIVAALAERLGLRLRGPGTA